MKVTVPLLSDQRSAIRKVVRAFAWIDRIALETTGARKLVDHLDQAILTKAFRGEPVPQDPKDEPVNVLLERIRAKRVVRLSTRRSSIKKKCKVVLRNAPRIPRT